MKILHVASGDFFSNYGGGQVYVRNVADEMIRQGLDTAILSTVSGRTATSVKQYKSAPLYEVAPDAAPDEICRVISLFGPDIIHAHSRKAEVCAAGRKLGIPVVVTAHHGGLVCPAGTLMDTDDAVCRRKVCHRDCLPCVLRNTRTGLGFWYPFMRYMPEKAYRRLGRMLQKLPFIPFVTPVGCSAVYIEDHEKMWQSVAAGCTLLISPCRELAGTLVVNGLCRSKVRVVPHGIPLPAERPPYVPVRNGKMTFCYIGRICYVKGIHVLLEAFSAIRNQDIELVLIGGAGTKSEERYMRSLRKKYSRDKRIVWRGKLPPEEIFDAIKYATSSSSSSSYVEAFGLNIAESLAMGKPVIATRCGGAEMQIRDGINGWLVPSNDPAALTRAFEKCIAEPSRLEAMSANCHAISIADHVNELCKVYAEAIYLNEKK